MSVRVAGSIQVNRERHLMAQNKLTMRQIQEILRLKHQNQLSVREIARSCGLPASTVGDYLKRAEAAGLSWPLPEGQSEAELLQRCWPLRPAASSQSEPALPDWPHIHKELARKSVTLQLLWQEYRQAQPEGYGYSRFCELYRALGGHLGSGAAADSSSRREDVCGLGRPDGGDPQRPGRQRFGGPLVCGGAGGQQ